MPTNTKTKETEEEMVNVSKTALGDLQKQMASLQETNKMLLQVADKKRLSQFYSRNKTKLPAEVKLRMLGEKVIVGWITIEDRVWTDAITMAWKEKQEVKLLFEDGTSKKMPLAQFNRDYTYVNCQRTGIETDEDTGDVMFKLVRLDNNDKHTISVKFVN